MTIKNILLILICLFQISVLSAQCTLTDPDCDNDGICDLLDQCPNLDDALLGTSCDDGDPCTLNDTWLTSCDCEGLLQADSDNDGVCDSQDICPNFDDEMDIDKDGIPYCQDNCIDVNENGVCDDVDVATFTNPLKIHFSYKRGFYTGPLTLNLIANQPNVTIRYEMGANPSSPSTSSGSLYSGPLSLSSSSLITVKAIAYTASASTKVYTHTFIFDGRNNEAVVFSSSPYAVAPGEVEDPISFEFIVPHGSKLKSVQAYSGTKLSTGGASSGQSDKVFFRSEYNTPTLKEDLFSDHYYGNEPAQKIDQLFLRAKHNDDTYLRQLVAHDGSKAAGQLAPTGRLVHFYKNGQYTELRHLHERPEAGFMEAYTGIDKQNWEAITSHHYAPPPSVAYNSLKASASNWTDFKKNVNIESLSYFMIGAWISNVVDYWEDHNFRAAGPADLTQANGDDFSWHFFMWDLDIGYGRIYARFDGTFWPSESEAWSSPWQYKVPFLSPEYFLNDLRNYDEFNLYFADVIHCSMRNDGAYTADEFLDRIWYRVNEASDFGVDNLFFGTLMDTWMPEKEAWLFNEMKLNQYYPELEEVMFSEESGILNPGSSLTLTNPNAVGDIYYTLDGNDVRLEDGTLSPSAILYTAPLVLSDGVYEIFARVYDVNALELIDSWSAHCCTQNYIVNQNYSDLVINEIHYNPSDSIFLNPATSLMDTVDGRNFEFVELKNVGTSDIDINQCRFNEGIHAKVDKSYIVGPGDFVVFAEDSTWFHTRYGFPADFIYSGKLDNGGEQLVFANPKSYFIDTLTYNDTAPWDITPDLGEYSLALRTDAIDHYLPSSWEAQYVLTTPGSENLHCMGLQIVSVVSDESCPSLSDGSVSLSVSNGVGPFVYQWSHGPISSSLTNLSPATYSADVTDTSTGCIGSATVQIDPATPPSPIDLNLVTITSTSIITNWQAIPNNGAYFLQYKVEGASTWINYTTSGTAAIISNLLPCTDYEIRIGGDCSADGINSFSPIKTFSTDGCFVCTAPVGLFQFNIQNISAIITWDVLVGATDYTYKFRKVGDPTWISQTTTFPIAILFGISTCSDYEWTIETTCYDGSTAMSSTINNFSTLCKNEVSDNFEIIEELNLFPNPTKGNFTVQLPYNIELAEMNIYNPSGQIVYSLVLNDRKKEELIQIDINDLNPGLYTLSIGEMSKVFLKQ